MNAAQQRAIVRWLHILVSIPIFGYIYGPVADMPGPALFVKAFVIPFVVLSGFWLWKGHLVRKAFSNKRRSQRVS